MTSALSVSIYSINISVRALIWFTYASFCSFIAPSNDITKLVSTLICMFVAIFVFLIIKWFAVVAVVSYCSVFFSAITRFFINTI